MSVRVVILMCLLSAGRLLGAGWQEDFATDPRARGWQSVGEAELFRWDSAGQALQVRWDSSKANSYFYRALGTVLSKADDVQVSFDLRIDEIHVGTTPGRPFTFELAVGLMHLPDATRTNFVRGTAKGSPNLLEFDYFPDSGFGATVSPTIVSSNNQFMSSFTFPLELGGSEPFHIELTYSGRQQTLVTTLSRNGQTFAEIKEVKLSPAFTDFLLDTFAVASYSDQGADGSIVADGQIDNVVVTVPDPPSTALHLERVGNAWRAWFIGAPSWRYTLERSGDLGHWETASKPVMGLGEPQALEDGPVRTAGVGAFYRLRLERP